VGELHLGVILPNYGSALDAEHLAAVAVAAEDAGFDSGWVSDHLMVPAEIAPVYGTISEALVSLGFLAARTQRLRLGVSALVVPQRNPLVALKQVTSLDFLSGGRVVLAVAAGWLEQEFETLGSPFRERGRRLDDWLPPSWPPTLSRSGSQASPMPRFAARPKPASGIPWRCPPHSSRSRRGDFVIVGPTAALCCV
jgi:alkanesulfonate monooxygenase SsuD/methylene tetrahydromethanopterin reductase-like flavin-dependent oxidoreductase (luciferase family)